MLEANVLELLNMKHRLFVAFLPVPSKEKRVLDICSTVSQCPLMIATCPDTLDVPAFP
jgi:tRNA1(Val) A37 N6-methylase TrmN6